MTLSNDDKIEALRVEALLAGDTAMADTCSLALVGDDDAREQALRIIALADVAWLADKISADTTYHSRAEDHGAPEGDDTPFLEWDEDEEAGL